MSPIQAIGSAIGRRIPAYNAANSLAHLFTGTLGQHGESPSLFGKLTAWLAGNPTNAPRATAVGPTGAPAPAGPGAPPPGLAAFLNAYPGSFGNFNALPGEISAGGPVAGFDSVNGQPVYNPRGVLPAGGPGGPGAPPPSSLDAFGPGGLGFNSFTRTVNPYDPNASRAPSGHDSSIPGWAALMSSWIKGRTQI